MYHYTNINVLYVITLFVHLCKQINWVIHNDYLPLFVVRWRGGQVIQSRHAEEKLREVLNFPGGWLVEPQVNGKMNG